MDWIMMTIVFLSVVKATLCFNIEPVAWAVLRHDAAGFGYQVVQRRSDLLVSAPLEQYIPNGRGQIFRCTKSTCQAIGQIGAAFGVNMSLGLTMAADPSSRNTLACGPTIPRDCRTITMYSGVCFQIDQMDRFGPPVPPAAPECRNEADIAFLLDGSGSVIEQDFTKMIRFVKSLVRSFLTKDTQFAIAQFSRRTQTHYFFNDFLSGAWETKVDNIEQLGGGTYTATAISTVVQTVFTETKGSRPNVKKILIVITDGESDNTEKAKFPKAINDAEAKKIVRFAIGVGRAFIKAAAKRELEIIASAPSAEHVFQVESFDALDKIRQTLQSKIFSIEGTQNSGESLKMEMAQQGFSAAYVPGGFQMGIVGANQWKGGYVHYTNTESSFEPLNIDPDSYVGYSMAVAKTISYPLTITGAPRYKHRGVVLTTYQNTLHQTIEPSESQIQSGEYFGAEVCAMDVNSDGLTDLILISAPMYKDSDREGIVYVCTLTAQDVICEFDSPLLLRSVASARGRFGSSLAVLPDLNKDQMDDLAVGAPLENDGQGSIYIFQGEAGTKINPTFSQRISASEVHTGLKFFGMSISPTTFDHSGDKLPDLAVGSKGNVVLLRSRPLVLVSTSVSFTPNQIQTQNMDCSTPLRSEATLCFTMTSTTVNRAEGRINYTFTLDATRKVPNNRAYVSEKQREASRSVIMSLGQNCFTEKFFIEPCQEDAFNELRNELKFTFDGRPSADNLRPSLHQQAQTTTFHPLGFEINCGADKTCVDNLKVDFNFNSSSEVKVGIDELLVVNVSVENRGENSYNTRVILTYPPGLSYRKFTAVKGRVDCSSLDGEGGVLRGKTDCTINRPIFKNGAKTSFIVNYGIDTKSQLDRRIFVTANATSGNQKHDFLREDYKLQEIDVKYSIFVTFDSTFSYTNFTFGRNDLQKPFTQLIKVSNHIRALNLTVVIRVPVRLGDKDIWVNGNNLQIPGCLKDQDEEPLVKDFVPQIQKNKTVDCSVARCSVFRCTKVMGGLTTEEYKISANLSSRWIEQIGLPSAKFLLTSTASLGYDTQQYIFFSTGSNNNPPIRKIEAEVEVYQEQKFIKEIVGGSLGGLALLALLTAGLYKAGFFKSKYKNMMNEAGQGADPGDGAAAAAPEKA